MRIIIGSWCFIWHHRRRLDCVDQICNVGGHCDTTFNNSRMEIAFDGCRALWLRFPNVVVSVNPFFPPLYLILMKSIRSRDEMQKIGLALYNINTDKLIVQKDLHYALNTRGTRNVLVVFEVGLWHDCCALFVEFDDFVYDDPAFGFEFLAGGVQSGLRVYSAQSQRWSQL